MGRVAAVAALGLDDGLGLRVPDRVAERAYTLTLIPCSVLSSTVSSTYSAAVMPAGSGNALTS
ncbi:MAG TPA: hypothetical protein VNO82_13715 [Solirubrobacteraceae bacterium]|nr:hypothetical protein [Solirubrobacteraceae bacterium]